MQRLFRFESETETLQRLVKAEVPPIREKNPTVPEDAAQVIHRMLAASPRNRPDSMEWVENQLNRALAINYTAEQSSQQALAEWLGPRLDSLGAPGAPRRKTMVLEETGESVTQSDRPRETITEPSAPTDPDENEGPPTRVDLTPPDFD